MTLCAQQQDDVIRYAPDRGFAVYDSGLGRWHFDERDAMLIAKETYDLILEEIREIKDESKSPAAKFALGATYRLDPIPRHRHNPGRLMTPAPTCYMVSGAHYH